jgi:beta-lactamase regulating signal transducer with metallopeptidase domain
MSNFTSWLSPELLRPLGWTLLHFLWQGAALAAILAVLHSVFRSASGRYVLGVATLVLMMAAPVITFAWLLQRAEPAATPTVSAQSRPLVAFEPVNHRELFAQSAATAVPQAPQISALLALVEIWFVGVLFLSLRTAGGLFLLEKMRRKDTRPVTRELYEKCLVLQQRIGLDRFVHYCECAALDTPAVLGWFRPMVLLPATALTGLTEAQIEAVIAHELAHIRRFDGFVNLFQIAVETLLFYHPAVWWVSRRVRIERENCCDDAAISIHGDAVDYARALTLMEQWRTAPALAMAANRGPLATRVFRLLSRGNSASSTRVAGLAAGLLCLVAALLAGNACLGVAHASLTSIMHSNQEPGSASVITVTPNDADQTPAPASAPSVVPDAQAPAPVAARLAAPAIVPDSATMYAPRATPMQAGVHPLPAPMPSPRISYSVPIAVSVRIHGVLAGLGLASQDQSGSTPAHSYLEGMESAGMKNLSVDELIAMKIQGITPEYIKSMEALGFKPNPDELIGMKVQGITPEYVKETRAIWPNVGTDELIGMKVQGVTPEYMKSMQALGLKSDPDSLIGMKVQGITPEYVKEIRAIWPNADTDQLIGIKVQGVTPQYVQSMHALGLNTDPDEIIGMKVQGITPEYVKEIRATWPNADTDQLIGIKVQGITPQYVREISDLGYKPDADEIVGLKVQGVTAAYIKSLQNAGLGKMDLDDIIGAKVMGITPEFIENANKHGFKNLTLEKLISLKNANVL